MPQHENSIRSALCTDNDSSLIGRAARIPFNCGLVVCLCVAIVHDTSVPQHSNSMHKAKEGLRGEFALCIHSLGVGPRLPIRTAHLTKPGRTEGKEKRW